MIDDHPVVTMAVSGLLQRDDRFTVRTASSGPEALAEYNREPADVVLCDLSLDSRMSGVEVTRRLVAEKSDVIVVAFTSFTDPENVTAALDAGASGYLTKSTPPEELPDLLWAASKGEPVYDKQTQAVVFSLFRNRTSAPPAPLLTPRELELLTALCETGASNRELAESMFLSESTVSTHLQSVFNKLGVSSRAKAIAAAYRTGLVQVGGRD